MKMRIFFEPKFKKQFIKLPKSVQKKALEKITLFEVNPFLSSLKTHKLKGHLEGRWSFSVDHDHRIIFKFDQNNKVKFYLIGNHKIYE